MHQISGHLLNAGGVKVRPGIRRLRLRVDSVKFSATQNDNVVSINAALQVDLTGAVNADHMLGHQYSATGGQLDFVRGAYASRGGKSIIACHSTAARGKVSRIVARLDGPVTTPGIDTHMVVTEFGWTNLKRKSSTERARALIALAHPEFQGELTAAAKEMHLF